MLVSIAFSLFVAFIWCDPHLHIIKFCVEVKFKDLADLNRQHIYAGCCRLTRYIELQRLQLTELPPNDEEPGSNQLFVKPVYRTEAKKGEGARVIGGHVIDGYVIEAHAIRAHVVLGHVVGGRVLRGCLLLQVLSALGKVRTTNGATY